MVSTSSCEAKYIAASEASKEGIWLCTLLTAVHLTPSAKATSLLCNNNGTITFTSDPSFHSKVKHIDIKYHLICEYVNNGQIFILYINTHDNIDDMFTKLLESKTFCHFCSFMGLS